MAAQWVQASGSRARTILTMSGNPLDPLISSDVMIFYEFHHSSPKPKLSEFGRGTQGFIYNKGPPLLYAEPSRDPEYSLIAYGDW